MARSCSSGVGPTCEGCGARLEVVNGYLRPGRRYCNHKCRAKARRDRLREETEAAREEAAEAVGELQAGRRRTEALLAAYREAVAGLGT